MNGSAGGARNSHRRKHPPPEANDSEGARALDAGGQRDIARPMHQGTNLVRVLISIDGLAPGGAPDLEQRPGTQASFLRPRAYLYRRRLLVVAFIEGRFRGR